MSDFPALDNLCNKIAGELQTELRKHNPKWKVEWKRNQWDATFRCSLGHQSWLTPSLDLVYASMLLDTQDLAFHYMETILTIWGKENDKPYTPVTADKVVSPRKASRGNVRRKGRKGKRQ